MTVRIIAAGLIAALIVHAAPTASTTNSMTRSGSQRINGTIYAGGVRFGDDIREISADITVPTCSVGQPSNPYTQYQSDGWIGMGAYSKVGGLIQAGVTCYAQNGTSSYRIWTEYFPALQDFYEDTDIQAGDIISARVVAHNKSSGTTYLHNKRTGKKHSTTYTNQTSAELTFRDAEWITESRLYLTKLGPEGHFDAKYTPWQFRDARYVSKDGKSHKSHKFELVSGSHMLDTVLDGIKIAEGIYDRAGHIQVDDTTPENYTVPGYYGY